MKIKIAAAGLLAILAALPLAAQQAAPDVPRPSILILGTVHFGGSTADLFSPSVPDILSEYVAESPNLRLADPLQYLP